jgi:hydroxyquinol 1,2-dioxygenase
MRNLDEHTITAAVVAQHIQAASPRLRRVMTGLVQHLHAFAREVELTEDEWSEGIRFLTRCGDVSDAQRQEYILLSDVLGLSTLVTAMNHRTPDGCTEAAVLGPFHVDDAPELSLGADVANGAKGEPCFVHGQVRGIDGLPVPHAELQVWQADADGLYDVQYGPDAPMRARAILHADDHGRFRFRSIVAQAYPIPHDGPVGDLLSALGRHPRRPAHLHFMIQAPGYERLVTQVFREGDPYLDSDAVFGVRSTLIADWIAHPPGVAPDGALSEHEYHTLAFDFVLAPIHEGGQTVGPAAA